MRKMVVDTLTNPSYRYAVKRKYLISVSALALLLVSCLGWVMENPTIVLREIHVKPRSFTEVNLLIGLDVQNPNRFDLTLKSFEYTVFLNREEVGNGRLEKEILIPASSVTRVQVPVEAKFKDWRTTLKTVVKGDDMPYRIEGKSDIKTVFGSIHYPFSKEGRIDLKK